MHAKRLQRWAFLTVGMLLVLGSAGCIFSPDDDPQPPPPTPPPSYIFPDTEAKLLANFRESYSKLDIDEYRNILHTNYRFFFQDHDITTLGLLSDHYNRDDELDATTNMFSGEPKPNPGAIPPEPDPIPAISNIEFSLLDPVGTWGPSFHPDFPNARRALYTIELSITRPGAKTIVISGRQEFYVISRDSVMTDGSTKDYFQLLGQVDMSVTK
ncbi:MAG: hypothetical protein ABIF77_22160 [bacterium]